MDEQAIQSMLTATIAAALAKQAHAGQNEKRSNNLQKIGRPSKFGAWIRYFFHGKKVLLDFTTKSFAQDPMFFATSATVIVENGFGFTANQGDNHKFKCVSHIFFFCCKQF